MAKWIPVTERLPEINVIHGWAFGKWKSSEEVLAYCDPPFYDGYKERRIILAYYDEDTGYPDTRYGWSEAMTGEEANVIAWMPMPEPYEGGKMMNKYINRTLMALVPILRMNGEKVKSIEAVHDWYKGRDREYMKEVAEIVYDSGHCQYADIGSDSNLTAIYDVLAVIQRLKPESSVIERIERDVYLK